jgi:hypothetical protein
MTRLLALLYLAFGLALPVYGCADDVNAKGDVNVDEDDGADEAAAGMGASEDDEDDVDCAAACEDDACAAACEED